LAYSSLGVFQPVGSCTEDDWAVMAVEAAPSISASAANKPIVFLVVFFACNLDIAVLLIENLAILDPSHLAQV
jgi:hypothetical protein